MALTFCGFASLLTTGLCAPLDGSTSPRARLNMVINAISCNILTRLCFTLSSLQICRYPDCAVPANRAADKPPARGRASEPQASQVHASPPRRCPPSPKQNTHRALTAGGLRSTSMLAVNAPAALAPSLVTHSHYSATLCKSQYPNPCRGQVVGLTGFANFCRRCSHEHAGRGILPPETRPCSYSCSP